MDMRKLGYEVGKKLMKLVVRIADVVGLVKRFEASPAQAMREVVGQAREAIRETLEKVMDAEVSLFLGRGEEAGNKLWPLRPVVPVSSVRRQVAPVEARPRVQVEEVRPPVKITLPAQ